MTGLTDAFGLELNRFGYPIDPETGKSGFKTSIPGVFTAGDVITGTKFVIDAIAGAREVTTVIDQYLGGEGKIDETLVERTLNPSSAPSSFGLEPRVDTIVVDPETRMSPSICGIRLITTSPARWHSARLAAACSATCVCPSGRLKNFNAYSKR